MEDLSLEDLLNGLRHPSYSDHYVVLWQLLSNMICEESFCSSQENIRNVILLSFEMFRVIDSKKGEEVDLIFTCLSNLTQLEANCEIFRDLLNEDMTNLSAFKNIISIYLSITSSRAAEVIFTEELDSEGNVVAIDPFDKVSYLLCNLSRLDFGRKLLMDRNPPCYMPYLIQQIELADQVRVRGAVGCLRNCLFDPDVHWWMLQDLNVLPVILKPLVVNTPFTEKEKVGMDAHLAALGDNRDTKPNPDKEIIKMLLDCIVLLCQRRWTREYLRKKKIYPICRNIDYFLEDDKVNDIVFEIVNFLERDEDLSDSPDPPTAATASCSDTSSNVASSAKADDELD